MDTYFCIVFPSHRALNQPTYPRIMYQGTQINHRLLYLSSMSQPNLAR
jgi:hypothetical protein